MAKEWAARLATPKSEDMKTLRFVCEYALYGIRSGTNRKGEES
jgi:hypothetical protein